MNKKQTSISFYGGVGKVTGANFLLEHGDFKCLIDCGMTQGSLDSHNDNRKPFPYNPSEIPFLFLTHAHIDHIGLVPKLVRDGFNGVIFSTPLTKEIAHLMLSDGAKIASYNSKETGEEPLYEMNDVENSFALWQTIPYNISKELSPNASVLLKDAGHILGSSMFIFSLTENGAKKRVLFTGDLGNSPSVLIKDTEEVSDIDYAVMDSVYGDRNHESKESRDKIFKETVLEAIRGNKTILIPAFSLERTQVILYELNELIENKEIPSVPVFLDSPLAIKVTRIYEKVKNLYNDDIKKDIAQGDKIFDFPKLKETANVWESKKIHKIQGAKIIIAGSGMSTGGRILSHEKEYLPKEDAVVLLIGYQAPGTLGRKLQDGIKNITIDEEKVPVRAEIRFISGFSSHKDSDNLILFIDQIKESLKKVFVVMGEPKSSLFLSQRLRDFLGVNAIVPEAGKKYKIN